MRALTRWIRRVVPSTASLGRQPLVMGPLALLERALSLPFHEFRPGVLPPTKLRARIGVSDRLICNQAAWYDVSKKFWFHAATHGLVRMDSHVVDIGCGCGRMAHFLRAHVYGAERFGGQYLGVDVDREMIAWCQANYPERFRFEWADVYSAVYNPTGQRTPYRIPRDDNTQDFVFSVSLLTHLLADDVTHYLREAHRLLKPGGAMSMTAFVLEDLESRGLIGGRWTFQHTIGPARVESVEYPEAAVAYPKAWFMAQLAAIGFTDVRWLFVDNQSVMEARKA